MEVGAVVRFMDRHPWLSFTAGVGIATLSLMRIRRERRIKREAKARMKMEKVRLKAERKAGQLKPGD